MTTTGDLRNRRVRNVVRLKRLMPTPGRRLKVGRGPSFQASDKQNAALSDPPDNVYF